MNNLNEVKKGREIEKNLRGFWTRIGDLEWNTWEWDLARIWEYLQLIHIIDQL